MKSIFPRLFPRGNSKSLTSLFNMVVFSECAMCQHKDCYKYGDIANVLPFSMIKIDGKWVKDCKKERS